MEDAGDARVASNGDRTKEDNMFFSNEVVRP